MAQAFQPRLHPNAPVQPHKLRHWPPGREWAFQVFTCRGGSGGSAKGEGHGRCLPPGPREGLASKARVMRFSTENTGHPGKLELLIQNGYFFFFFGMSVLRINGASCILSGDPDPGQVDCGQGEGVEGARGAGRGRALRGPHALFGRDPRGFGAAPAPGSGGLQAARVPAGRAPPLQRPQPALPAPLQLQPVLRLQLRLRAGAREVGAGPAGPAVPPPRPLPGPPRPRPPRALPGLTRGRGRAARGAGAGSRAACPRRSAAFSSTWRRSSSTRSSWGGAGGAHPAFFSSHLGGDSVGGAGGRGSPRASGVTSPQRLRLPASVPDVLKMFPRDLGSVGMRSPPGALPATLLPRGSRCYDLCKSQSF